jgi:chemosensory pili system protein ChpA (sensor histidine kinase/response regulator)
VNDPRDWILIVDDDEDIRDVLALVLEGRGYRAVGAFDGLDALDQLRERERPPLLILLDLMMPRLNGFDFAKQVRARPGLHDVPIVILSGDSGALHAAASLGPPAAS